MIQIKHFISSVREFEYEYNEYVYGATVVASVAELHMCLASSQLSDILTLCTITSFSWLYDFFCGFFSTAKCSGQPS